MFGTDSSTIFYFTRRSFTIDPVAFLIPYASSGRTRLLSVHYLPNGRQVQQCKILSCACYNISQAFWYKNFWVVFVTGVTPSSRLTVVSACIVLRRAYSLIQISAF